jgi:sulfur-oxidizing protein SoxB
MQINRREFARLLGMGAAAGVFPAGAREAGNAARMYDLGNFGEVRLLHFTDCHAQLNPIYFREPSVNLGVAGARGKPPHLVGEAFLRHFGMPTNGPLAHAFTYLDFAEAARTYGKVGGFAHLATLVKQLRQEYGSDRTLLLDGGDTWQGSGTSLWTRGRDMVDACNLLGVDVMTGHWEFTYQDSEVLANIEAFNGDFVAQNVLVSEEALFGDAQAFDEFSGHAFPPYVIKTLGARRVAIIGQAFPYTPIANPHRFIPDWTFGIQAEALQELVDDIEASEKPDAIVLLSHNGMDVDLKLAREVGGIDAILGGHTHDGIPRPIQVTNSRGTTLVTNAGSNGKFLGVLEFSFGERGIVDYRYRLLPVFSNVLPADNEMRQYIDTVRAPYLDTLTEELAVADELLYRRGNFNGSFDQIICDAQRVVGDAQIALSPGFRWGTSVLPGQPITMENLLGQTAITYPETYVREMSGAEIRLILEDVADNLFNPDPFYQQGGDMVRVGGMDYEIAPNAAGGQRISAMTLGNGQPIEANKTYKVAGWATVGSQAPGRPIWEVVADYLRDRKTASVSKLNTPRLKGVEGNPGLA